MGNINQLEQKNTYNKILLKIKAKSPGRININKGYKKYKNSY